MAKNSSRITSPLLATTEAFAASVGHLFLAALTTIHLVTAFPLGALDDDPGVRPRFHVFVAYKAPWFDITDALPQFQELPKNAP